MFWHYGPFYKGKCVLVTLFNWLFILQTFHLEQERPPSGKKKPHHCPPDDIFGRVSYDLTIIVLSYFIHLFHTISVDFLRYWLYNPVFTFLQETAKKKAAADKIKRRNYEIRVLKGELSKKSQDLNQSKRRLMTLEHNDVST